MSLMRYDPFATALPMTMRDAMDRLLEEGFTPAWRAGSLRYWTRIPGGCLRR